MFRVFDDGIPKMVLSQRNHSSEAFRFNGSNESFRVCIQIGTACRQLHCLHAGGPKQRTEPFSKQWIAIVNEIATSTQKSVVDIRDIARNLPHPLTFGLLDNAGDLNSARLKIDDEEHKAPN
jgi:hypothetical protein